MGNRSWRWAGTAAGAAILVAASVGCSSSGETVSSSGSTAPSAATGATRTPPPEAATTPTSAAGGSPSSQAADRIPPTTYGDLNESTDPVPVTEAPTIPATGQDPSLINCGTVYRASGWPTTMALSPDTFTCLGDAFAAGTPARLVDRAQTDGEGGAILITTYDVLGPASVRVTVDATAAADRPQGITVSMCTGLTVAMTEVATSGCTVVSG